MSDFILGSGEVILHISASSLSVGTRFRIVHKFK